MSSELAQVETEKKTETVETVVVKAVLLRNDGTSNEIDYEIAPKKNIAKDILGAPPTIIGEWDEIQVILIRGKHGPVNVPFNQHKLRYPFNGRQFRGDILLYRVNKDGKAENFTLQEYEAFVAKPDESSGKEVQEPCMDALLEQSLESSFVSGQGDEEEETISEEDLRREIAEAFEIIRAKGRHDAQYLAELVSETFYEINGREAELEDIANVFKRVKEQLAEEANDEVLDDSEEEVDQITAAIKKLLLTTTNQNEATKIENREELLAQARSAVSEATITEAREKFIKIAGRELTSQELEDLLIHLSKPKNLETLDDDENDSDYCPLDEAEQEQARADELEDLAESEEEDKEDKDNEETEEPVEKKPIKFFSPVRTKKTTEQLIGGLDSVDRKLMDRVVHHFRNIHKREPTEEENANLWKFLTTGGLPVCELESTEKVKVENKSPDIRKVNFDTDDEEDSENVPEEATEEILHVVD